MKEVPRQQSTINLTLNEEGGADLGIIRISEPKHRLRVIVPIGTEFHKSGTVLFSVHNYEGKEVIIKPEKDYSPMIDIFYLIDLPYPGAFKFYLENEGNKGPIVRYIVDPIISINKKEIPSSGLVIQTNYGRCIGPISEWLKNLESISDLGYNMIHLPPFQELGQFSHYSIKNQMQVSEMLYPKGFKESERWPALIKTFAEVEEKLGIVFMADIVLNHTSEFSPWLEDHPEAGYNEENAPHLIPAIYIDNLIHDVSLEIAEGKVPEIPPDIQADRRGDLVSYLEKRIYESEFRKFFIIDENKAIEDLKNSSNVCLPKQYEILRMRSINYGAPQRLNILRTHGVVNDGTYKMGSISIDNNYAIALFRPPGSNDADRIDEFRLALSTINAPLYSRFKDVVNDIITAVVNAFCYNRYDENGPKLGPITKEVPIAWRYFTPVTCFKGTPKEKVYHLANNGWIFGSKPTINFVSKDSEAYLRRQIVIWGDCVKLNFGELPEDNPWLWNYFREYVESVAKVVKGLRLDNAHSTPLPVAEYFIQAARRVNPSLYIMAELFTGGDDEDIKYINHIGINSVVRESFHNLHPGSLTHLLWLSGGLPVAAIDRLNSDSFVRPMKQIPGVIYDITHDNQAPHFDRLSIAAAISMASSPVASSRGFDDYLPFNPSIVTEFRKYPLSADYPAIQRARKILNLLHTEMASNGQAELNAQHHGNVLSLFRSNSHTGEGVWMVVRFEEGDWIGELDCVAPVSDLIIETRVNGVQQFSQDGDITPSSVDLFLNTDMSKLKTCYISDRNHLVLSDFPVGTVVAFRTKLSQPLLATLKSLKVEKLTSEFAKHTSELTLTDISVLMFRCAAEENCTIGRGPYNFPVYGECFYAGTQGIINAFDCWKDMSSVVFQNIREGDWLANYMCDRLSQLTSLAPIQQEMRTLCDKICSLPRFLIPKYIDRLVRAVNIEAKKHIVNLMSDFIKNGDDFVRTLAYSTVALYSYVADAPLVSPMLQKIFEKTLVKEPNCCLAAGLPHFSSGYMRSWGRDTMISLRGIFMTTGRWSEARDHLIVFASCLRHGLIPNLHDACLNPRYNARDATWFFLQALQDYDILNPSKENVFDWDVPRLFPTDYQHDFYRDWYGKQERPMQKMSDIVMEILSKHAKGIHFVEWNAGKQIDSVMKDNGFHIDIVVNWNNGFILGGNADNCGTWMDKMGSSEKAGNSGVPSTPRDGAAVEIIGLLTSTLRWLSEKSSDGIFPYDGVDAPGEGHILWSDWYKRIQANFESWFYIPTHPENDEKYFIEQSLVSVRGVYKDTVGASNEFGDYQFRPNILVAMTVAPELFDPVHSKRCLNKVEERLAGRIGMKTLDPGDWRYNPYYDNSDDSDDFFKSHGANYHCGPEWVWPTGYFYRASMKQGRGITPNMKVQLAHIKSDLINSWAVGLPELTQKDGEVCHHSCVTQSWSSATMLDLLFDYHRYSPEEIAAWSADSQSIDSADR